MVKRWDIITIGHLSRNRYWGESEDKPVRPPLCTCTLVTGADFRLLVDPSLAEDERMAAELNRRSGLAPSDIDFVFVTHAHGDHHAGLGGFPEAAWLADAAVADAINILGRYGKKVEAASGRFLESIDVVPTPGHTLDHHALNFECEGHSIVIAGDAVMTRDFWRQRQPFFNAADLKAAVRSMDQLERIADILVPGHDNYFLV